MSLRRIASHCILLTSGAADAARLVSIAVAYCAVTTGNIDEWREQPDRSATA
jgi:hypothetical protein